MKNQKKKRPKKELERNWEYRYKGPQKTRHTADINHIKTAHRKKIKKKK